MSIYNYWHSHPYRSPASRLNSIASLCLIASILFIVAECIGCIMSILHDSYTHRGGNSPHIHPIPKWRYKRTMAIARCTIQTVAEQMRRQSNRHKIIKTKYKIKYQRICIYLFEALFTNYSHQMISWRKAHTNRSMSMWHPHDIYGCLLPCCDSQEKSPDNSEATAHFIYEGKRRKINSEREREKEKEMKRDGKSKVKTNDKETRPRLYKLQLTENYVNFAFKRQRLLVAMFNISDLQPKTIYRLQLANANRIKCSIIINNQHQCMQYSNRFSCCCK